MRRTVALSLGLVLATLSSGGALAAQEPTDPSPSPEASPLLSALEAPAAESATITFEDPRWRRIDVQRAPAAREDHTWTVDADRRFAYLFGGRDGNRDYADLWRFDLRDDTWRRLSPSGRTPDARFGHSAVWVAGTGLVVFAGQKGFDFFNDLWVYDAERDRWRELPADGAAPRARYGSCMIVGRDGRVWISHGFTFAGRFDDTRAYNLRNERWASIAPDGRRPAERCLHDCWTSRTGELVLYGGQDDNDRALGDLWVMRGNGSWRREDDPRPADRRLYGVTEAGDYAYVFGGADRRDGKLGDLWRVDRSSHGFKRVRVEGNAPSARSAATIIADPARGRLLVFGGEAANGARGDLWELVDQAAPADEPPAADASALPGLEPEDGPVESTAPDA